MQVFRYPAPLPPACHGGTYAVGNFDGVHLGHQQLLRAAQAGQPHGVLTFSPHPTRVLNPEFAPKLIYTEDDKLAALAFAGVETVAIVPFSADVAAMSAADFVERVVCGWLSAKAVVVGEGFRFGHQARGTSATLRERVHVTEVPSFRVGNLVVSSSKIREAVLLGRVDAAAQLLGRPYHVAGPVVHGDARGRTIGVPTANVESRAELLPRFGVYAGYACVLGEAHRAVVNVGLRPTFQGEGVRIEAHLLDFAADLYGADVVVELVARIRDEQRFSGIDALKAQIANDVATARTLLLHERPRGGFWPGHA